MLGPTCFLPRRRCHVGDSVWPLLECCSTCISGTRRQATRRGRCCGVIPRAGRCYGQRGGHGVAALIYGLFVIAVNGSVPAARLAAATGTAVTPLAEVAGPGAGVWARSSCCCRWGSARCSWHSGCSCSHPSPSVLVWREAEPRFAVSAARRRWSSCGSPALPGVGVVYRATQPGGRAACRCWLACFRC